MNSSLLIKWVPTKSMSYKCIHMKIRVENNVVFASTTSERKKKATGFDFRVVKLLRYCFKMEEEFPSMQ